MTARLSRCTADTPSFWALGILGGMRPLTRAHDAATAPLVTAYLCKYLVTITLAATGAAFLLNIAKGAPDAALIPAIIAGTCTACSVALIISGHLYQMKWALFAPNTMSVGRGLA